MGQSSLRWSTIHARLTFWASLWCALVCLTPLRAQAVTATGGNSTNESGGYRIHTFTSSGTLTVTDGGGLVEYLLVGGGIINVDPLFASEVAPYDVHLKARGGRWTAGGWVSDAVDSPCIDAGDPASDFSLEPYFNGDRINMGRYGNTAEASRKYPGSIFLFR